MKKSLLFTIALAFCASLAAAHCGNCPGDKKEGGKPEAAAVKPAGAVKAAEGGKKCGDCPNHKPGEKCECSKLDKAEHKHKYACPKGCGESDKPGKCPVCGTEMKMVPCDKCKGKEGHMKKYMCPGHGESDKPGKCAKCGAEMKKAPCEHGKAKEEAAKGKKDAKAPDKYMCAMKCVEAAKPGKCPKCGMPMEKAK